jgi:diaminopimelate decarboxylase
MAFAYRDGMLHAEQVPLGEIARRFGTPCYVYSRAAIEGAYREFSDALRGRDALVCYSVKANSNLAVLALLARLGAGFDIVSGGELARVIAAGGDPRKTLFSGVGKREDEIEAALKSSIGCLNVESEAELARVAAVAHRLGKRAPIALRVNPDIDAKTHPYISTGLRENKFGVAYADAEQLYRRAAAMPGVEVIGIGFHIGSLLVDTAPFVAAVERIGELVDRLEAAGRAPAPHRRRRRHRHPIQGRDAAADQSLRRWRARGARQENAKSCLRSGPFAGGERRPAARADRARQARRSAQFRHRRRGDERPHPAGAVQRLA